MSHLIEPSQTKNKSQIHKEEETKSSSFQFVFLKYLSLPKEYLIGARPRLLVYDENKITLTGSVGGINPDGYLNDTKNMSWV